MLEYSVEQGGTFLDGKCLVIKTRLKEGGGCLFEGALIGKRVLNKIITRVIVFTVVISDIDSY